MLHIPVFTNAALSFTGLCITHLGLKREQKRDVGSDMQHLNFSNYSAIPSILLMTHSLRLVCSEFQCVI